MIVGGSASIYEIWAVKGNRYESTLRNAVGIYIAAMGVFIHILQPGLRCSRRWITDSRFEFLKPGFGDRVGVDRLSARCGSSVGASVGIGGPGERLALEAAQLRTELLADGSLDR